MSCIKLLKYLFIPEQDGIDPRIAKITVAVGRAEFESVNLPGIHNL